MKPTEKKSKTKAAAIVDELRRIQDAHAGWLKPEDVIMEARPSGARLHDEFEWNDGKAAHKYRMEQARELIQVCVEYYPQTEKMTRVFVSLSTDRRKGGGYRDMRVVLGNREYREQMLQDALEEMQRFRVKYAVLKELASVFSAMSKAERQLALKF